MMGQYRFVSVPTSYDDETFIPDDRRIRMALLRLAGYECKRSLLGDRVEGSSMRVIAVRCRLCNTEVILESS